MPTSLFGGIPVRDHAASVPWYVQLFGRPATFMATDTESVWQVTEVGWLYVVQDPERAGRAIHTLMVDDLETVLAEIAGRGLQTATDETYDNGTRKVTYRDPDGNEIGYGAVPSGS